MPDSRATRGPHPDDQRLFSHEAIALVRQAAADYLWLLNRGYAQNSSIKLVGDRFRLARRQRTAIARSVCADNDLIQRNARRATANELRGKTLLVDGFNLVVTLESALSGGMVLRGRDGCSRDLASMHGTYRKTAATPTALVNVGEVCQELGLARCCWYFDQPVSNSGRLAQWTREIGTAHGWTWESAAVRDPDRILVNSPAMIATADSAVLKRCRQWFSLASHVIERTIPTAWIVTLSG